MEFRKTTAFVIALSMIVGLFGIFPASALTITTDYAEEILLNESFDGGTYNEDLIYVENGNLNAGALNFMLSGESGFTYNQGIDKTNCQTVIYFDMKTNVTYNGPWNATFIGPRMSSANTAPWDNVTGMWLGITNDKFILWDSHDASKWESKEASEGVDFRIIDNDGLFDVSDARYMIIYEGDEAELYIDEDKDNEGYRLMASFGYSDNYGKIVLDETEWISDYQMKDSRATKYFSIWNNKDITTSGNDPLAPGTQGGGANNEVSGGMEEDTDIDPEDEDAVVDGELSEPEEASRYDISFDSFSVSVFRNLLMTEDQLTAIEELEAFLDSVVDNYGTEERIYLDESVDFDVVVEKLAAITEIKEAYEENEALSEDAKALTRDIQNIISQFLTEEDIEDYISKFNALKEVLEAEAEDAEGETLAVINALLEEAEAATLRTEATGEFLDSDPLTASMLNAKYKAFEQEFSKLNIYTQDGIVVFDEAFIDNSYTSSQFNEEWYVNDGRNTLSAPTGSEIGLPIEFDWSQMSTGHAMRFDAQFKKSYENYSVQATLTFENGTQHAMTLRAPLANQHEDSDYNMGVKYFPTLVGARQSVIIAPNPDNFNVLYIGVNDIQVKSGTINVTEVRRTLTPVTIPSGYMVDGKTVTILAKDMDDLIEIYAVHPSTGEKQALATIYFDPSDEDTYTAGTLINEITDFRQTFSGYNVLRPLDSYVGFGVRGSLMGVKDFKIAINVLPDPLREPIYVTGPLTTVEGVDFKINGSDTPSLSLDGGTVPYSFDATYENLKIYGFSEYLEGTQDKSIKDNPGVTYSTLNGDSIIKINTDTGRIEPISKGTEIVLASFTYKENGEEKTKSDLMFVEVTEEGTADKAVAGEIVSAKIVNESLFKSLPKEQDVIPQVSVEYPNGTERILDASYGIILESDDASIIEASGDNTKFTTKDVTGLTNIRVLVPYNTGNTEAISERTRYVVAEIVAEVVDDVTPGLSRNVAVATLINKANDDITDEEFVSYIEGVAEAGMDIPALSEDEEEKVLEASYIKAEIVSEALTSDATEEEITKVIKTALGVKKVADILQITDPTVDKADTMREALFLPAADSGNNNLVGAPLDDYDELSKAKKTRVATRVYKELVELGADALTSAEIKRIMATIIESVAEGGGAGDGVIKNETDKNTVGNTFTPGGFASNAVNTKLPLLEGADAVAVANNFWDINEAEWAKEAIGSLAYEGVVAGYEDGSIRPNHKITRDEFAKLLISALKVDTTPYNTSRFSDIPFGSWQSKYVEAAAALGIVYGTEYGIFGTGDAITREEMATMIYRAVVKYGISVPTGNVVNYKDAESIADYALEAVNRLSAAKIISGMGNDIFAPTMRATRAQAITMIFNLRKLMK